MGPPNSHPESPGPGLGSEDVVDKKEGREEPRWLLWKHENTMLLAAEATRDPSTWWQMAY